MKTLIALLLLLAPVTAIAADGDHLVPENSVFYTAMPPSPDFSFDDATSADPYDYYRSVLAVFHAAYERNIFARVIVIPGGPNEYAIALSRENETWKIIYLRSSVLIFEFDILKDYKSGALSAGGPDSEARNAEIIDRLEAALPETIADVTVETCALEIDDALGRTLYSLWLEMLFRTRHVDDRPLTPDGDYPPTYRLSSPEYHFSFDYSNQRLTGHTWNTMQTTNTGKFVAITMKMRDACDDQNTGLLAAMRYDAEQLLAELAQSEY